MAHFTIAGKRVHNVVAENGLRKLYKNQNLRHLHDGNKDFTEPELGALLDVYPSYFGEHLRKRDSFEDGTISSLHDLPSFENENIMEIKEAFALAFEYISRFSSSQRTRKIDPFLLANFNSSRLLPEQMERVSNSDLIEIAATLWPKRQNGLSMPHHVDVKTWYHCEKKVFECHPDTQGRHLPSWFKNYLQDFGKESAWLNEAQRCVLHEFKKRDRAKSLSQADAQHFVETVEYSVDKFDDVVPNFGKLIAFNRTQKRAEKLKEIKVLFLAIPNEALLKGFFSDLISDPAEQKAHDQFYAHFNESNGVLSDFQIEETRRRDAAKAWTEDDILLYQQLLDTPEGQWIRTLPANASFHNVFHHLEEQVRLRATVRTTTSAKR